MLGTIQDGGLLLAALGFSSALVAMIVGLLIVRDVWFASASRSSLALLSGVLYQLAGVAATLWASVFLASLAGAAALLLPPVAGAGSRDAVSGDD